MSLKPKPKKRKYTRAKKRAKFYNQWTKAERKEGMGMMLSIAADYRPKRYITRKGKSYELIDASDDEKDLRNASRKWFGPPEHESMVIKLGYDAWGLYVHAKEESK